MVTPTQSPASTPQRGLSSTWQHLVLGIGSTLLVLLTLLRITLLAFVPPGTNTPAETAMALLRGTHRDLVVVVVLVIPLLAYAAITPLRWWGRPWHTLLCRGFLLLFWGVQAYLLAVEYYFFEEFRSRLNTVSVDYLLYPHEVFVNIWEAYPVGRILTACATFAVLWTSAVPFLLPGCLQQPQPRDQTRSRFRTVGWLILAAVLLLPTVSLKGVQVSRERTLNEVANNGTLSFISAFWTRHLDYTAFYRTLAVNEAYTRARALLQQPGTRFIGGEHDIRRHVEGDPNRPKLNLVVILEESLGSEFWGSLGHPGPTLTPEMDQLAQTEGLLFTNLYASGNRTVRGLEGVLASFPPLPGDSIVKRTFSDNVDTLGRILKRDGYQTVFLYGGRGVFDGMRAFTTANGYDRFIEQKHFENPTFTTIWGVCDEDLMNRAILECRTLAATGKPFHAAILSVSNHKPFTYPRGRIPENPDERQRGNAVKYADYALGQFFKAAKKEAFWTNTVFAVVADHGARVYGSQSIPIHSYEIPLVIAGPAIVHTPQRVGSLGGSLDVAPTLLGLIGRPYDTVFFGRDLLRPPNSPARLFLNHNRDIGLYRDERLVVLGLRQGLETYAGDPKRVDMKRIEPTSQLDREVELDATALFQTADDLYIHERYRIDP